MTRVPPWEKGSDPLSMKCLLVADMHYALKQYDWVLHQAAAYDIVVIAGDHLDISSTVDIRSRSLLSRPI